MGDAILGGAGNGQSDPSSIEPPKRAVQQKSTTILVGLSAVALIIGGFVAGVGTVGVGIISSYGGMFNSVQCFEPNVPACTGSYYYYYGVPGVLPLSVSVSGVALIVAGIVVLTRSLQRLLQGHQPRSVTIRRPVASP